MQSFYAENTLMKSMFVVWVRYLMRSLMLHGGSILLVMAVERFLLSSEQWGEATVDEQTESTLFLSLSHGDLDKYHLFFFLSLFKIWFLKTETLGFSELLRLLLPACALWPTAENTAPRQPFRCSRMEISLGTNSKNEEPGIFLGKQ